MKLAKVSTSHIQAVTGTTFVATLSSLLFGYATAVISGAVGAINYNFIAPRGLSGSAADALLGLTVCSALLGTILGALIARPMASLLGRKRPMILASILFMVSALGSAYPEIGIAPVGDLGTAAIWPFNVYRMLGGVAVGIASMIAPMYVGEFAPSAVRGQLGAYQQIAIIGGMTIAYCVNWGISLQGDDAWVLATGWRWMMLALSVPAIAFFYLSFSVPESPSWLVRTGRIDEARRVLSRSAEPDEVRAALAELADANRFEEKPAPIFSFGGRVVFVGVALSVFQQLVGINTVLYYGPEIFAAMGYHMDAAYLGTLVACIVNLLCTMVVVLIVDKVGRKPLLIVGGLVMGVSMLMLGSLFHSQNTGILGLIAICLYLAGFALSFGPIVWIMLTEIYPAPIRGQAMSIAVSAQWIANLLVSATFPLLLGNDTLTATWNHGFPFWVYGSFGILAAFVVLRYVPETRGVDSEALAALWRREDVAAATAAKA
ncbi:MAG TPA: sugar porter family MFS transporter [Steroidobacteraceae bacterium]|jgi:SP family xylose:H+ symportor-like MFS transporter|nr:sugar porter family MFS transporter [Steroidobacteraceae bacterium]